LSDLTLNLKKIYFDAIKSGEKVEEYREMKPFWEKRLKDRNYDRVVIKLGYPPKDNQDGKVLYFKWKGYTVKEITHEIFDNETQNVYAIDLSEQILTK
jgi:hypothetical protein